MRAAVAGRDAGGHGAANFQLLRRFDRAIAAENPDDRLVLVTLAKEFAVDSRILRRENLRADAPLFVDLIAPCWKQTNIKIQRRRPVDDPVRVFEIIFIGLRRIVIQERQVAFSIRDG